MFTDRIWYSNMRFKNFNTKHIIAMIIFNNVFNAIGYLLYKQLDIDFKYQSKIVNTRIFEIL